MMANPPSSHPPKSSTHRLLAAFHKEIGAYLSVRECHLLASTSRWGVACHTLASRRRSNHSSSTDTLAHLLIDESEKVTDLHAWLVRETSARFSSGLVLATGTRKTKRRRDPLLSAAKLRSVMRDLVLVASGMRASCLVDCCVLEPSLVALLLDALTSAKQSEWAVYGCFEHVYAVLLDGNVFFVNAPRFLKEKSIDLATGLRDVLGVNVGAHLRRPEVLFPHGEKTMRVVEMCETIETVCQRLIHLVGSPQDGRVLSLRKSAISATALAGILLCYPVIYDLYDPGNAELDNSDERGGPGWELQENCLSMCPLHVFQTSIISEGSVASSDSSSSSLPSTTTLLREFSIPSSVLLQPETPRHPVRPTLALIKAVCKVAVKHAIEESVFASSSSRIVPDVQVTTRLLPRVAL